MGTSQIRHLRIVDEESEPVSLIAAAAGGGNKTWHAYLSTSGADLLAHRGDLLLDDRHVGPVGETTADVE